VHCEREKLKHFKKLFISGWVYEQGLSRLNSTTSVPASTQGRGSSPMIIWPSSLIRLSAQAIADATHVVSDGSKMALGLIERVYGCLSSLKSALSAVIDVIEVHTVLQ
jgi:hypothetical protein